MARPKGSKNKTGAEVKAQILACYERMGGLQAYEKWARAHESEFYKTWATLAPKEVDASVSVRTEADLTDAELAAIATGSGTNAAEPESGEIVTPPVH